MGLSEVADGLVRISNQLELLQDYILMKFGTLDFENFTRNRTKTSAYNLEALLAGSTGETTSFQSSRDTEVLATNSRPSIFCQNENEPPPFDADNDPIEHVDTETDLKHEPGTSGYADSSPAPELEEFSFEQIKVEHAQSEHIPFADENSNEDNDYTNLRDFESQNNCEQALDDFAAHSSTNSTKIQVNYLRRHCVVEGCKTPLRKIEGIDLSWHSFPIADYQKTQRLQWIDAIRNSKNDRKWNPVMTDKICSRHFENKCYLLSKDHRTLYAWAVPTLNLNGRKRVSTPLPKKPVRYDLRKVSGSSLGTPGNLSVSVNNPSKSKQFRRDDGQDEPGPHFSSSNIEEDSILIESGVDIFIHPDDNRIHDFQVESIETFQIIPDLPSTSKSYAANGAKENANIPFYNRGDASWVAVKNDDNAPVMEKGHVVFTPDTLDRPVFGPAFPMLPPGVSYCLWCSICGKRLVSTGSKSAHKETHGPPKPCKFCEYKFRSFKSVLRHVKKVHPEKANEPYYT